MLKLKLIGHDICPYVQRVAIMLHELAVTVDRVDIDLENKPDWLYRLSPMGQVPILIVENGAALFESQAIADYLAERYGDGRRTVDLLANAQQRAWLAVGDRLLSQFAALIYQDRSPAAYSDRVKAILALLGDLDRHWLAKRERADGIRMDEIVFATAFRYLDVILPLSDAEFSKRFPHLSACRRQLLALPSIQQAVPSDYRQRLIRFVSSKPSYLGRLLVTRDGAV